MGGPTSRWDLEPGTPSAAERNLWIEKWQRGIDPEESFRHLFKHYYSVVYAFFIRRGFPEAECDDLVQETFLRVAMNLGSFRGDSHFETWLFQVTTNVYRNELRSRAAAKRDWSEASFEDGSLTFREDDAPESTADDPLGTVLNEERAEVLHRALVELPPQMRRCVELRIHHDLKYREIAVLLRISVETVKAHLFQARQRLKATLGDYFSEPGFTDSNS